MVRSPSAPGKTAFTSIAVRCGWDAYLRYIEPQDDLGLMQQVSQLLAVCTQQRMLVASGTSQGRNAASSAKCSQRTTRCVVLPRPLTAVNDGSGSMHAVPACVSGK